MKSTPETGLAQFGVDELAGSPPNRSCRFVDGSHIDCPARDEVWRTKHGVGTVMFSYDMSDLQSVAGPRRAPVPMAEPDPQ